MDSPGPNTPFQEALDESFLPPNGMEIVEILGRKIVLIHSQGKIHALENTCPHLGGSLGRGTLKGNTVICPLHHWTFDIDTGRTILGVPGEKVPTYPVKVENGKIYVQLP